MMGRNRPSMSDRSSASAATGVFGARANASLSPDVVDAEYIVVDAVDVSDRNPAVEAETIAPPVDTPSLSGMDMLRRRALRSTPGASSSGGPIFWIAGGALVAAAFWVSGGHAVMRPMLIQASEPEQGLRIASVISKVDRSGLRPVLQIDGQAVNDGRNAAAMPPLKIEVLSPAGGSMHYKLGTAGSPVEGGASFAFSSRLDLPKDGVKTVFVTFAE
jgi:hypothetical protein